jgi:hypothetical protein
MKMGEIIRELAAGHAASVHYAPPGRDRGDALASLHDVPPGAWCLVAYGVGDEPGGDQ